MKWKWPWDKSVSAEVERAQERLDKVIEDDQKVAELTIKARRIIRQNNFAPTIIKALGVNGK